MILVFNEVLGPIWLYHAAFETSSMLQTCIPCPLIDKQLKIPAVHVPAFALKDGLGKCIDLFSTSVKTLSMPSIDNNEQRVRQCCLTNPLTLSALNCKYLIPEKVYCLHRCRCIIMLQFLKLEGR